MRYAFLIYTEEPVEEPTPEHEREQGAGPASEPGQQAAAGRARGHGAHESVKALGIHGETLSYGIARRGAGGLASGGNL